jgi:hypothetical protein
MSQDEIRDWVRGRVPDGWFLEAPEVRVDGEEILIVGRVEDPGAAGSGGKGPATARAGRVQRFREESRDARVRIAHEAEHRFGRRVSWGVDIGDERRLFTTLSTPVMTRLRLPERQVLDTLVEAGVARSRSDALAWCVRLVGRHQADWIGELRQALVRVGELRRQGPS